MTLAHAFDLQGAVYRALAAALAPLPVFAYPPDNPPPRYCRIDGFTMAGNARFKNLEQGDHAITVHVFDAPVGGTSSLNFVRPALATAWAAIKALPTVGGQSIAPELASSSAAIEVQNSVKVAHAFFRFNVTIGE